MTIVNSEAIEDIHSQPGGGRYVLERHTDSSGFVHSVGPYLAAAGFDVQAKLAARAITLAASLAVAEVDRVLRAPVAALNVQHQTAAEFALSFWVRVLAAFSNDKVEFGRLIWWIAGMVAAGHVTDAQARTSFNTAFERSLTAGQWTTFKTSRLAPVRDRYQAMLDEAAL